MNVDELISSLRYDYAWKGFVDVAIGDASSRMPLTVKADSNAGLSEIQRKALKCILERNPLVSSSELEALYEYCKKAYDRELPKEQFVKKISATRVVVDYSGAWGITFAVPWEPEMEIAIRHDDTGVSVGLDDIII